MLTVGRRKHWIDPRLVVSWSYEADAAGVRRLVCTMGLPDGVKAEVPPPVACARRPRAPLARLGGPSPSTASSARLGSMAFCG